MLFSIDAIFHTNTGRGTDGGSRPLRLHHIYINGVVTVWGGGVCIAGTCTHFLGFRLFLASLNR